jgi:hypothetical protein
MNLFGPTQAAGHQHVTIVGAGSIGANLFTFLSVMGVQTIEVWDADRVELRNLSVLQGIYRPKDIGRYKVDALAAFADRQELPTQLTVHAEFVTPGTPLSGVVFACTDSMASRRATFEAAMANLGDVPHLWDLRVGRMQVKTLRLNLTDAVAVERYSELYLPDDSKVKKLSCAEREITDPPAVVAAYAAGQYRQWATHQFGGQKEVIPKALVMQDLSTMHGSTADAL